MRKVCVFLMSLITMEALAMSLPKTCVFSAVKAQITINGEPVKQAMVIRKWEWNDLREETTQTDDGGYFQFPAVFESSVARFLPVELVIAQGLYVVIDGEEKKIWSNSKREPDENAEFNGKPISLICELTDEMKIYRDFGSRMNTLCRWE
jgi:hypothetical protein